MNNIKINLFQNMYKKELELIEGLQPYFKENLNNNQFEYVALFEIFNKEIYKNADYTALLSPRFKQKTNLDGYEIKEIIRKNPGYDVYLFNPFLNEIAGYYNIWTQGEYAHPGLNSIAKEVLNECHNLKIEDIKRTDETNTIFCNFWVGSQKFWKHFLPFLKKISNYCLENKEKFFKQTSYKTPTAFYTFLLERMVTTYIYFNKNIKVYSHPMNNLSDFNPCPITRGQYNWVNNVGKALNNNLGNDTSLKIFYEQHFNNCLPGQMYYKAQNNNDLPKTTRQDIKNLNHLSNHQYPGQLKLYNLFTFRDFAKAYLRLCIFFENKMQIKDTDIIIKYLFSKSEEIIQDQDLYFLNLHILIYELREDLHTTFKIFESQDCRRNFTKWCKIFSINEVVIPVLKSGETNPIIKKNIKKNINGFNLIGFAKKASGQGEDLRTYAKALKKLNIPFNIIDIEQAASINEVSHLFQKSIFFLNLPEIYKLKFSSFGLLIDNEFFRIGFSPWEISNFPKSLEFVSDHLDQIWAISDFVHKSYGEVFKGDVKQSPMLINRIQPMPLANNAKNLSLFRFLYVLDARSYLERKNPEILIKAFKKTFRSEENVSLILKISSLGLFPKEEKEIDSLCKNYNIKIIKDELTPYELQTLYMSSHVYVSPHRCEGFGRTILEAMIYGLPVISTNYSGNLDFCKTGNFIPIDFNLIKVNSKYPFTNEESVWADPIQESLESQMRFAFKNYESLRKKAKKNSVEVLKKYSIDTNLKEIENLLDVRKSSQKKTNKIKENISQELF
jgi:glycosyltransferase involved in cell wall biosynthesis